MTERPAGRERALLTTLGILLTLGAGAVGGLDWYRAGSHGWSGTALSRGLTWTLALAGACGFVLVGFTGRVLLGLLAGLEVLLGLLMVAAPMLAGSPGTDLLKGVTTAELAGGAFTGLRWLYSALGLLVAAVGVGVLARYRTWPDAGARFRRDRTPDAGPLASSRELWQAQDAGIDPTE